MGRNRALCWEMSPEPEEIRPENGLSSETVNGWVAVTGEEQDPVMYPADRVA